MSAGPLVTAVIPAYNAKRWVGEAVRSVLAQTYRPVELIVVDDGSTDQTGDAVRAFGAAARYVRQENSGVSLARNLGASEGHGEFIAFLDADDAWAPHKVETQVRRLLERPTAVVSFMSSVFVNEGTGVETVNHCRPQPDLVAGLLLYSCIVGNASSVMVRRDAFSRIGGFDPAFSQCADWDMWIRLAELGPVDIVDEPLVRIRTHRRNMSRNVSLLEADTLRLLAKFFAAPQHFLQYGPIRPQVYCNQYLTLSGSYLHAGRLGASLRCLASAISHDALSALLRALGTPTRVLGRAIRTSAR